LKKIAIFEDYERKWYTCTDMFVPFEHELDIWVGKLKKKQANYQKLHLHGKRIRPKAEISKTRGVKIEG